MAEKDMAGGPDLNYYCSYCGRLFRLKWQLTAHVRIHEKRTPYICHVCPASFVRNSDLKNHLKCHSDDRPYKCKFCPKAFKTKFSKECHEDTHGVNSYKCTACEESFSTYMKLNRHKKRHKKSMVLKKNGQVHYQCAFCSSFFLSIEFKKHHEETIHHKIEGDKDDLAIQASKCPICFKKFPNGKDYRTHVYEIHPNEAENVFYTNCTICNKRVSAAFYSYHMMAHNGIKPHACTVCDIKFTRKHDLLRHMDIHSEETPFKCSLCPKKFKCKKNLNMHLKSHLKKDQLCNMCNKSFATKEKLSNHKNRIHLRDQNLEKCVICQKEVLNQYMSRHMKEFHCHDEKLCDHCGQTFPNAFKLRIHITRYCKETETYKAKALYQQHVKTHSSANPDSTVSKFDSLFYSFIKECFLCGLTFFHKKTFKNHLRSHEYNNWELMWNAKNIYRRKKSKGKGNSSSTNTIQDIYVVKDIKRQGSIEGSSANNESKETIITKYKYVMQVKKEFSWIYTNHDDKKKLSLPGQAHVLSQPDEVRIKPSNLFTCNKCMKVNKVLEMEPNNFVFTFTCEYCSNVNECINNSANFDNSVVNNSFSAGFQVNAGISSFNIGMSNIFPLIIVAPPLIPKVKVKKSKPRKILQSSVKIEEPKTVTDKHQNSELRNNVKNNLENGIQTKLNELGDTNESVDKINISISSDDAAKEKVELLKAMKEKLAVLQGKQFISIEDLKQLKDCNINTLLDYL